MIDPNPALPASNDLANPFAGDAPNSDTVSQANAGDTNHDKSGNRDNVDGPEPTEGERMDSQIERASFKDAPDEIPTTETERQEMEAYVKECRYLPGTAIYDNYQTQCASEQELPDLFEEHDDYMESSRRYSRRVRCYIPWQLAREWEDHHHSARSPSILLQEAMRAELERTPLPRDCPKCGEKAEYNGFFWLNRAIGHGMFSHGTEVYTCSGCGRSHMDIIISGSDRGLFYPGDLEDHERWRHDNGIIWVDEEDYTPEYREALAGFLRWTEYERARKSLEDPGFDSWDEYIPAHEGRRRWDELMAKWAEAEMVAVRQQLVNDLAARVRQAELDAIFLKTHPDYIPPF